MIHADQRRSLRQPISLNRGVAQSIPELFGLSIQCGASADKRPKFPAKLPANVAKDPPPTQEVLSFRRAEPPPKALDLPPAFGRTIFQIAFNLLLQRLQN